MSARNKCARCGQWHEPCEECDDRWVSVKERLPDTDRACIVRYPDAVFEYDFARWFDGEWRREDGWIMPYSEDVTHWRPLPLPPKEAPDESR